MSVARLRRPLLFQLGYDQRFHRPVANASRPRHNSRAVEGSGTAKRPPLESVHPVGATTLENQLLAVPLVRSIN